MYWKISQHINNSGFNKIVEKQFLRNNQVVRTKAAYYKDKLYYKEWKMEEHARPIIKYSCSFSENKMIPNTKIKLNYWA